MTTTAVAEGQAGDQPRYAAVQRWLHWAIALIVAGNALGGAMLWAYDGFGGLRDAFGIEATNAIYTFHKSFGTLLIGLRLLRLAARLALGAPPRVAGMPGWQAAVAGLTHVAIYALLFAVLALGWAATDVGGWPLEFFGTVLPGFLPDDKAWSALLYALHGAATLALVAVLALHIGAAMRHWLVERDGVMGRISVP
ncbi:MAG: cytochrome b/b6 domain-containing protein [Pseudomonadota bacterium]